MPIDIMRALLQQANAQGTRSTVLRPLGWLVGLCGMTLIASAEFKSLEWLPVLCGIAFGLSVLLYMGAFVYCLLTDRESLRTETYSIQKLAIEKGYYGDSTLGLYRADSSPAQIAPVSNEGQL